MARQVDLYVQVDSENRPGWKTEKKKVIATIVSQIYAQISRIAYLELRETPRAQLHGSEHTVRSMPVMRMRQNQVIRRPLPNP